MFQSTPIIHLQYVPGYSGLADDAPESDILTDLAFFPYMTVDAPDIEPLMLPVQSTQTRLAPETDTSISSEDTLELRDEILDAPDASTDILSAYPQIFSDDAPEASTSSFSVSISASIFDAPDSDSSKDGAYIFSEALNDDAPDRSIHLRSPETGSTTFICPIFLK